MEFDYFAENPYKRDEAKFNSNKFKGVDKSLKNAMYKILDDLDLIK